MSGQDSHGLYSSSGSRQGMSYGGGISSSLLIFANCTNLFMYIFIGPLVTSLIMFFSFCRILQW